MTASKNEVWKYCYWLNAVGLQKLKKQLEAQGIEIVRAEKTPCEALRGDIGYAMPDIWSVLCKYDGARWYHSSKHAKKILVVSSFPLGKSYTQFLETTIELCDFEPSNLPSEKSLGELALDKTYCARVPEGWGDFPEQMKKKVPEMIARTKGTSPKKFEDVLLCWDAVHANFLKPRYRAGAQYSHAPYSIADTCHISSCCTELFNLLDSGEGIILVRPCLGSFYMKVLEKDRYYLVRFVKLIQDGHSNDKIKYG